MDPYTGLSEIAEIARRLPQFAQEKGYEIRVLMPRYGTINERRHRLHEVVRLSGMNIIVDDDDYPLFIKVASLPGARMQVYFLDNDEFFSRKAHFNDKEEKPFEDNQDRMVFFCKGIMETVKKFGWPPDIIHCHGWMCSLIPLYLKEAYKNEPLFAQSKLVYSVYNNSLGHTFTEDFFKKALINNLEEAHLEDYRKNGLVGLDEGAIKYSDATIIGSENIPEDVLDTLTQSGKPNLDYQDSESYLKAYLDFYNELI